MDTDCGCFVGGCSGGGDLKKWCDEAGVAMWPSWGQLRWQELPQIKALMEVKGPGPGALARSMALVSRTLTSSLRTPNKLW